MGLGRIGIIVCAAGLLAGCGAQDWWLGARQGTLLQGLDGVSPTGQPADLRVSLRGGATVSPLSFYTVFFNLDGRRIGAAKTDRDGIASIPFTFDTPGLHAVTACLDPAELGRTPVPCAPLTVGVFPPEQKFLVVDLDKTLVASGFDEVLLGQAQPIAHAQEVLQQLAREYQVIYLTHRPEYLATRLRDWLAGNKFPSGPLLVSTPQEFAAGSEAFKAARLEAMKKAFPNLLLGVGDKDSDMTAYLANGMRAFLIVLPETMTPEELVDRAAALDEVPQAVQVITDWRDIPKVLAGQESFDRPVMQKRLLELARQREAQQRGPQPPPAGRPRTQPAESPTLEVRR